MSVQCGFLSDLTWRLSVCSNEDEDPGELLSFDDDEIAEEPDNNSNPFTVVALTTEPAARAISEELLAE